MGTSRNDPTFGVAQWEPSTALLGRAGVDANEQSLAIWHAALADRNGRLVSELSSPLLAEACRLAGQGANVHSALETYVGTAMEQRASGLYVELGRRALARTLVEGGTSEQFACELFAQAASHYASRDLPSFVGAERRVGSIAEVIALKDNLADVARARVRGAGPPGAADPSSWASYVLLVLARLTARTASE